MACRRRHQATVWPKAGILIIGDDILITVLMEKHFRGNLNKDTIVIEENVLENAFREMAAILSRTQYVKRSSPVGLQLDPKQYLGPLLLAWF